jgi:hypothetical protein
MYDSNLRAEVEKSVQVLEAKLFELEYSGIPFPTANYDLVLDIVETEDMIIPLYYFVDHVTRTLFWLDHHDMSTLLYVPGVTEPGHVSAYFIFSTHLLISLIFFVNNQEYRLESLYW